MSLRPPERSRRPGGSRSRSRSRDARPEGPRKDDRGKTKARSGEGTRDRLGEDPTRSGARESTRDRPRVTVETSSKPRTLLRTATRDDDDSDPSEYDVDPGDRYINSDTFSRRRDMGYDRRAPSWSRATPFDPAKPDHRLPATSRLVPRPYVSAETVSYPDEGRSPTAAMPHADYSAVRSFEETPLPSPGVPDAPRPFARPPPRHTESYSGHDAPHNPARLSRSFSYNTAERTSLASINEIATSLARGPSSRPTSSGDRQEVRRSRPSLYAGMNRLSVSGLPSPSTETPGDGLPPPSPSLKAYKGTYQSVSPLRSPTLSPLKIPDTSFFSSLDAPGTSSSKVATKGKATRRVVIYDPVPDAAAINLALDPGRFDGRTLVRVLPPLTHDQMLELQETYGATYTRKNGEGQILHSHIKVATDESLGVFRTAAFVTAMGRWRSERHWIATCVRNVNSDGENAAGWELLIEALFGRQNSEIREIKKGFVSKQHNNDLVQCIRQELTPDKFRDALLHVLEQERQEDTDTWTLDERKDNVRKLRSAVTSGSGGESTMLNIVVRRSDRHLQQVLAMYKDRYKSDFVADALKKSPNLVGEVMLHILNGAVNRPARDAQLLHHAIGKAKEVSGPSDAESNGSSSDDDDEEERYQLLISRLIRVHWEKQYFQKVKEEYVSKYRQRLELDVGQVTVGRLKAFCVALCGE